VRLGTQLAIGAALLLAVVGGAVTYHQQRIDGEAAAAVRRGASAIPVEIAPAELGTIRERIEAVGSTLARQAVDIVALSSGRIAEIAFRPGERVEAGAVLIRLDDQAEQAAVAEARAMLREAELALDRARKLRTNNTVAQATVDELEAAYLGAKARLDGAEKQLADRTVRAPFAGVVGQRFVSAGDYVTSASRLLTLQTVDPQRAVIEVPERHAVDLRRGQTVEFTVAARPGRVFRAQVEFVDPVVQTENRTILVKARAANPDHVLRPGMFIEARLATSTRPNAIVVPEDAVQPLRTANVVWAIVDGKASRRIVQLGARAQGRVEVLSGVNAGELIVVGGLERMAEGMAVKAQARGGPVER
jgi:membrane fusion protein, multidrug efflux system